MDASSKVFYYIQGIKENEWVPAQSWQRKLISRLEDGVDFSKNKGIVYFGMKFSDIKPIPFIDRPNILEEINVIVDDTSSNRFLPEYISTMLFNYPKKINFKCGIIANLTNKTGRVFIGVPHENKEILITNHKHHGSIKFDDSYIDNLIKIYIGNYFSTGPNNCKKILVESNIKDISNTYDDTDIHPLDFSILDTL